MSTAPPQLLLPLAAICLLSFPALAGEKADPAQKQPPPRAKYLASLRKTVVHFDFRRAPLRDILDALAQASDVPIKIGPRAKKALKRRKFRMKYVADRRGDQVLEDLCKAASLDFVVSDAGARIDLPAQIRKLRAKLGLKGGGVRLSPADLKKMLLTKDIKLSAKKQSLSKILKFLRDETGLRFVRLDERKTPPLTLELGATPLGKVLDKLLHPIGLDWMTQGNVILLGPRREIVRQRKAAREAKRAKKTKQPKKERPNGN